MSAYVVHPDHIDLLVTHLIGHGASSDRTRVTISDDAPRPIGWDRLAEHVETSPFGWSSLVVDHHNADAIAQLLLETCVAAVRHRYPDDEVTELPGPVDLLEHLARYKFRTAGHDVTPIGVIKAIHGYAYQTCEHRDWDQTLAKLLCDALEARLVRKLPGYSAAETWEWTRPAGRAPISLLDLARQ